MEGGLVRLGSRNRLGGNQSSAGQLASEKSASWRPSTTDRTPTLGEMEIPLPKTNLLPVPGESLGARRRTAHVTERASELGRDPWQSRQEGPDERLPPRRIRGRARDRDRRTCPRTAVDSAMCLPRASERLDGQGGGRVGKPARPRRLPPTLPPPGSTPSTTARPVLASRRRLDRLAGVSDRPSRPSRHTST
jgi:hypothetical protein